MVWLEELRDGPCKCLDCYDKFTLAFLRRYPWEEMCYILEKWDYCEGLLHDSPVGGFQNGDQHAGGQ
jgi:hypothetical protein